jgi:hypothetical protein
VKKTATFLLAIGLTSCFTPKASVVAETALNTAPKTEPTQTAVTQATPEKAKPTQLPTRNTGLRLPDMLGLPQDDQLRSAPSAPKDGKATVIARPPED